MSKSKLMYKTLPIMRFDPIGSFFDEDDELEIFVRPSKRLRSSFPGSASKSKEQLWKPHGFQVHEDEKSYSFSVDVPGVKAEDMKMELVDKNQALHLSGHRKFKNGDTVKETKFERRFTIDSDVDVEKINADLSNGVLTITAPKKKPAELEKESPRLIAINEGSTSTKA
eukprot:scaffold13271_cov110-Cylindrotheca_fusiformis.AAC.9